MDREQKNKKHIITDVMKGCKNSLANILLKKPKYQFTPLFFVMLTTTITVAVVVVIALSSLMNIRDVQVYGNQVVATEKIEKIAGSPIGKNIFLYSKKDAIEALKLHPYIEQVTMTTKLPHSLNIQIKERRPVGVIATKGIYLQFSNGGLLLDNTRNLRNANLPIITGLSLEAIPTPGQAITDPNFEKALKIVNAMSEDLLKYIQEINVSSNYNILAYTSNGIEVRVGNEDHIQERMHMLSDILQQILLTNSIEGKIEYIDIRFRKAPVIKMFGEGDANRKNQEKNGELSAAQEAQPIAGTTRAVPEENRNADRSATDSAN